MICRRVNNQAVAIAYASVFLFGMFGVISLAVDWGRAQTAKTELQDAVDAAARYAAAGLADNTHLAKAQQAAAQNRVDESVLTLQAADVETGTWNTAARAFVLNGTPRNTVRVTGRRTAARGNAVPLVFGRAIGISSVDVVAVSVARQSSLAAVGIDSLVLTGSAVVRRKATESGGGITTASNGAYTMDPTASIAGDALYYASAPTGTVSGTKNALDATFAFAVSTVPGGASNYGPINLTTGNNGATGNVYVNGDVYVGGTATVTLYGHTNLYVTGNVTFTGNCSLVTNGYRFYVHSIGTGTVTFSNNINLTLGIYAPNSAVNLSGAGVSGSAVGKSLTSSTAIDYVANLPLPAKATGGGEAMTLGGVKTVAEMLPVVP